MPVPTPRNPIRPARGTFAALTSNLSSIIEDEVLHATDVNRLYVKRSGVLVQLAAPPVTSVNGFTGAVVLDKGDVGLGNVDNTSDLNKPLSTAAISALALKADLASPSLTGVPVAPTATVDTNTTQLATTGFVIGQASAVNPLVNGTVAIGTSTRYARADHVHPIDTSRAAVASPTFTGTPAAPTAAAGTNTTQIATTAFVSTAVDAARTGLDVKASVRVATTVNLAITYNATGGTSARGQLTAAPNTLDGVTLVANDRILVKDQSAAAANGLYVVSTLGTGADGVWNRAADFDQDAEVTTAAFTFVSEGTVNADSGWILQTNDPLTVGGASGSNLVWVQFSGAGQITAGAGLTKSGNTLDVGTASAARIVVNADSIDLAAAGTAGTYRSVSTDLYGRVTSGSNPTTFAGYGLSDTSANLAAAISDETGTGALVFAGSPALTGVPTSPTAATGTGTTQVATCAFVKNEIVAQTLIPEAPTDGNYYLRQNGVWVNLVNVLTTLGDNNTAT